MPFQHLFGNAPHRRDVALPSGRVDAQDVAAFAQPLGLVDGAGIGDQVAERRCGALAVAREKGWEPVEKEAAFHLQPARKREVVEGHDRRDPVLVAADQQPTVVVQCRPRELAFLRLDPRPLDAEPKCIEAQAGHQDDVIAVAMVEVARITRWLDARCAFCTLPRPPVAVNISPLDLVRRLRGAK